MQLAQQGIAQGHIAYQGAPGGFSEELASSLSPGLQPLPCQQYEDAFLALTGFAAEKALVPIENSLGGSIHEILDLLLRYNCLGSSEMGPSFYKERGLTSLDMVATVSCKICGDLAIAVINLKIKCSIDVCKVVAIRRSSLQIWARISCQPAFEPDCPPQMEETR